jgi:cytochrome b pre-mRNA-processing protein 3
MFVFGKVARARRQAADRLYGEIVSAARRPGFYATWSVPDTSEGRYEMIALHAYAVMRRLRGSGEAGTALSQALFDTLFEDMDRNLREMGIGDMGVGKRIKRLAKGFYGRIAAYDTGLAETGDDARLIEALRRNVYGDVGGDQAPALARYLRALCAAQSAVPESRLLEGRTTFPAAPD